MRTATVDRIEEEIRSRFAEGLDLAPATVHFIESTFGAASPGALFQLLEADNDEAGVLVDLLFSPEEILHQRIERHLPPEGLLPEQRERLAVRLRQDPLGAQVRAGKGRVPVSMPGEMVDGFLDRLCLDRTVDAALLEEVSGRYSEREAMQVRSCLRQARLFHTEAEKDALSRFFNGIAPAREEFWPLLDTLIGFLTAATVSIDLFAALAERKSRCLRHLRQAADRRRSLERHNIETILIGGDRMPHVDTDALAEEIVRIDDLGRILFGRPLPAPAAGLPLELGEVSSREDLDRVVRFFTKP